jgi:hypothetical protein
MFKSLSLAAVAVLATLSMAHAADVKPVAPHPHKAGPCAPIMQACKNAGFTRGGMTSGKGLIADCVNPLEEGKTVAGVTGVDKTQIDACKADYQARKAKFDERMKNDPDFAKKVEARKAAWAAKHPDAPKPGVAAKAIEKLAEPVKAPDAAK